MVRQSRRDDDGAKKKRHSSSTHHYYKKKKHNHDEAILHSDTVVGIGASSERLFSSNFMSKTTRFFHKTLFVRG